MSKHSLKCAVTKAADGSLVLTCLDSLPAVRPALHEVGDDGVPSPTSILRKADTLILNLSAELTEGETVPAFSKEAGENMSKDMKAEAEAVLAGKISRAMQAQAERKALVDRRKARKK